MQSDTEPLLPLPPCPKHLPATQNQPTFFKSYSPIPTTLAIVLQSLIEHSFPLYSSRKIVYNLENIVHNPRILEPTTQKSATPMDSLPNHGEKREHIVAFVLQKIVEGSFLPGSRLTTKQIADELSVSLTPVREAFAELAGIGVIDLEPNRGATIHSFSKREIQDVCRVRRALECEAIRGAVQRIPHSILAKLDHEFRELANGRIQGRKNILRARKLDSQLHDTIAAYCGNEFLKRELQRLSKLFRSFRDASWIESESREDCDRLTEEAKEHSAIITALIARDKKKAILEMGRHINASSKYWARGIVYSNPTNNSLPLKRK